MKHAIQAAAIAKEASRNPKFLAVIADEAKRNPKFGNRLHAARLAATGEHDRPRNRRAPAALDPVDIAGRDGEAELRAQLSELDIEQLKDIVAQYGMDTANRVMKWKTRDKIADWIVDISARRARKGSAFRIPSLRQA